MTSLLLGAVLAGALAADVPVRPLDADRRLLDHTLANGLRVTVLEDPHLPVVATQHWVRVGSAQEGPRERGFAHLFEHLMFGGTATVDAQVYARLHTAHGGWENAWTSFDETVYVSVAPPEVHGEVLRLEADRLVNVALTAENLANEQRIVTEELRLRTQNDPLARLAVRALERALGDHPYAHTPVGTVDDIAAADLELARRFHATWYRPDHVHLVVVGPRPVEDVLADVEGRYGHLVPSGAPAATTPALPPLPDVLELREDVPPIRVTALAWPLPPAGHPDDAALDVLLEALSGGVDRFEARHVKGTRRALYGETVHGRLKAAGVLGFYSVSFFKPKRAAWRALERTVGELGELDWLTDEVVEAARRRLLRRHLSASYDANALATALGQAAWHAGSLDAWTEREARLRDVTRGDVTRAWATWIGSTAPHRLLVRRGRPE